MKTTQLNMMKPDGTNMKKLGHVSKVRWSDKNGRYHINGEGEVYIEQDEEESGSGKENNKEPESDKS